MFMFLSRRFGTGLITLILVSVFVFVLQKSLPGDPALVIAGEERDPEVIAFIREKYGFNDPLIYQYFYWLKAVFQGDFGVSIRTNQPVLELILMKIPVTLQLTVMAMFLALCIAIPVGIIAAVNKNTFVDYLANTFALSGISIPNFWLGIMLILLISVNLKLLPASGYESPFVDPWQSLKTTIMPAFVLGTSLAGEIVRHARSSMLGQLKADYVRTARSKGLSERAVIIRHAFRNALIPIVSVVSLQFGGLLSGAVLTEQIFSIPGFGKLVIDAVFNRDYAVVQAVVLFTTIGYLLMSLTRDILYLLINPKIEVTS